LSELTGAQKKYLRGLAHGVRPAVQVGVRGLEPTVLTTIDQALTARELVKVHMAGDRDARGEFAERIATKLQAELVGTIGRMAIFFRRHPDPQRQRVSLPRGRDPIAAPSD